MPGGAFYAWPNVTEACRRVGVQEAEDFRKRLLYDAGVAVLSDIHLGQKIEGDGEHIRFSYATSEANIREGLRRIRNYLDQPLLYPRIPAKGVVHGSRHYPH